HLAGHHPSISVSRVQRGVRGGPFGAVRKDRFGLELVDVRVEARPAVDSVWVRVLLGGADRKRLQDSLECKARPPVHLLDCLNRWPFEKAEADLILRNQRRAEVPDRDTLA